MTATVLGIIVNEQLVTNADMGSQCYIVTDKTNFYSEAGGQIADIGKICSEVSISKCDTFVCIIY